MPNNIQSQIQKNLESIQKSLMQEQDIILKYDKKSGVVKIYSQKVKRIGN